MRGVSQPSDPQEQAQRQREKRALATQFGRLLRKRRQQIGLSQERLADQVGYSWRYLNKLEAGEKAPSFHIVVKIAHALGLTLVEFFQDFEANDET